jgi:hypothetical protein
MTMTSSCYRLWREATDAGLSIAPAHYRDPETGELADYAYTVTGPGDARQTTVIADLEDWLGRWLAGFYADPAARERAAVRALGDLRAEPLVPWNEWAARQWEQDG